MLFISVSVFAQSGIVGGTVTEASGLSLPGVTVLEKGTSNSAMTDAEGKFKIGIPENAVLIFSFIGYETAEVPVAGRTLVSVVLKESVKALDEVVVIGYGSTTKKEVS